MSAVTFTLTSICAGGNHLTFTVTGDKSGTVRVDLSDLTQPITDEDALLFCRVIARLARMGRTQAQARTLLQAGVTVTV